MWEQKCNVWQFLTQSETLGLVLNSMDYEKVAYTFKITRFLAWPWALPVFSSTCKNLASQQEPTAFLQLQNEASLCHRSLKLSCKSAEILTLGISATLHCAQAPSFTHRVASLFCLQAAKRIHENSFLM